MLERSHKRTAEGKLQKQKAARLCAGDRLGEQVATTTPTQEGHLPVTRGPGCARKGPGSSRAGGGDGSGVHPHEMGPDPPTSKQS